MMSLDTVLWLLALRYHGRRESICPHAIHHAGVWARQIAENFPVVWS
jgi:hypothetical protein